MDNMSNTIKRECTTQLGVNTTQCVFLSVSQGRSSELQCLIFSVVISHTDVATAGQRGTAKLGKYSKYCAYHSDMSQPFLCEENCRG